MSIPTSRHVVVSDWEAYASTVEEAFRERDIVDHFERHALVPHAFESALGNIAKDLEAQPWLVESAGYSWAVERSAYRFAQEVLNQSRVLNALGGLLAPDDGDGHRRATGIATRQSLRWRMEDAEPYCYSDGHWHFIVVPFGWDNFASILLLALRAYARELPVFRRLFCDSPPEEQWQRAAKGLLLAALPIPGARAALVDSFLVGEMRCAHPWFEDAIVSPAEFEDNGGRTLWSISSDWVVGHEVAHAIFHERIRRSLEREMQADIAGLVQMLNWPRRRDLTSLAPDISQDFWTYLSARIGLMTLTLASRLELQNRGERAATMLQDTRTRAAHLRHVMLHEVRPTSLTCEEVRWLGLLEECFDAFLIELSALHAAMPPWARAEAHRAARQADRSVRTDLATHKARGGGLILPD